MTAFAYRDGLLHAESVGLDRLAQRVGTPFFCYASAALEQAHADFVEALSGLDATICYALKANSNQAVIRTFALKGCGADVVSGGELRRALQAGVPANKIVFAGVGKTGREMSDALEAGIWQFNVESLQELELLARVAADKGQVAPVALRVNPHVDARTHAKISTGMRDSKFGIDRSQLGEAMAFARDHEHLGLYGLAVHIGSQLTAAAPFESAFERLVELYRDFRSSGYDLSRLDLGGGLGIAYRGESTPDLRAYAATIRHLTAGLPAHLIFEPGRRLVGNAGILVTRVLYVKTGGERCFVVVDAAMNDLIRPSLYDAWHEIIPIALPAPDSAKLPVDIVGPICESSDTFARQRPLAPTAPGDLLAICSSGAYGSVMSSSYNTRAPAPEIMVRGGDFAVVRPRMDYADLIGQDALPGWLQPASDGAARGAA